MKNWTFRIMILQTQHRYTFYSLGSMHRDPKEQTYLYSGMVLYSKSNSLYMLNMIKNTVYRVIFLLHFCNVKFAQS